MPLTDTAIRTAKPKERAYKLFDGGGLYLEVAPAGGKWWRLKYRIGGREKRISLGVYPTVGLKEARERREAAKKLLSQAIDPGEHKKQAKAAAAEAVEQATTFEAVAREWYGKKHIAWTPGHQKKILSRLENQLFPYLGNRPFSSLEVSDYLGAIQKAEARGAIETAHRLAQLCGQISRYARISGIAKHDMAAGLTEALSPVQTKHYAAITSPTDLGHLLLAIDAYQGEPAICHSLRILPYVFVRSGELRGAMWEEIDLDAAEWIIPAERMKMRRPHVIPLARQVVKLLHSMRDYSGTQGLVFPSSFSASRCISDMGLLNALRRMGYGKEVMTVHGFRTTASTLLNEQGYNRDWIEAQLAHAERNAIRDAYNRAEYLPERRRMMQEWADYLDSLKTAGK
ncbi:tyrosine-type recombinase/integrase [Desulfovibrio porci]|uniref:tyrosine-type recombinase/integrase n=1 Tax=Desulfovibrio porci TaxID=2605782 RepID=UPI003A937891